MSDDVDVWTHVEHSDKNVRSGAQMRQYARIADRIAADVPGGKVLDWGCGFGQVSDLMLARGLEVTSFEYRADGGDIRQLDHFPHISAHTSAEPVAVPFEDDSFDAVLSCGVLEHVPDPPASLTELRRVLKPGGTLYVYNLANRRSYLERIAKWLGMYYHGKYPNDRVYTLPQARELVAGNGYRISEIRMANMLPLTVIVGPLGGRRISAAVWAVNQFLGRIPGLNLIATNIELIAVSTKE